MRKMANLFYHLFFWSTRPLAPAIVSSKEFRICICVCEIVDSIEIFATLIKQSIVKCTFTGNNIGTHIYHDKSSGLFCMCSVCVHLCVMAYRTKALCSQICCFIILCLFKHACIYTKKQVLVYSSGNALQPRFFSHSHL